MQGKILSQITGLFTVSKKDKIQLISLIVISIFAQYFRILIR